jgi:hypothetical protein
MIIKEYGLKDLEKARKLQQELLSLHIPTPVMSWSYEIKDTKEIIEKGIGKSNSYTRNALNMLAWNLGMCAYSNYSGSYFQDGLISVKGTNGTMLAGNGARNINSGYNPLLLIGTGTDVESLDSYNINSVLTAGTVGITSVFNDTTRILTTIITRGFTNQTGSSVNITEAGVTVTSLSSSYAILIIRDVFTPIAVANGQTIVWTYKTEVAYPNP